MLTISVTKVPPNFGKCVLPYLYKVGVGLYAGDVTRRVCDYLLEVIPKHVGPGHAILLWKNSKAPCGFELFEISGDGATKCKDMDGIIFLKE